MTAIKQISATGDVTTIDTDLRSAVLTSGTGAATLTVKAGGSGGTTVLTVKAGNATDAATVAVNLHDAQCGGGVHATLSGTGAVATFVYS